MRRLVFLLGSGVSIKAGMPRVQEITKVVRSGVCDGKLYRKSSDDSIWDTTDQRSVYSDSEESERQDVLRLIQCAYDRCKKFYARDVTYEDVAYLIWQVEQHLCPNYENVALVPLTQRLGRLFTDGGRLKELSIAAGNYIRSVTADFLSKDPSPLGTMPALIDLCRDTRFKSVEIFTLNHDRVVEAEFAEAHIPFTDGFDIRDNDRLYWNAEAFSRPEPRVRLWKLHGGIDWSGYSDTGRIGKGGKQIAQIRGPRILLGGFNKILDYSGGIYLDMFINFRLALRDTNRIVVSGYGFRDKGINRLLLDWWDQSNASKLCIIHDDPDGCLRNGRGAVEKLIDNPRVVKVWRWFGDVSATEILSAIGDAKS